VPIDEYIELPDAARVGKTPYILASDDTGKLIKVSVGHGIVGLVEDRKHYWQTLQFLAGRNAAKLAASHEKEIAELKKAYDAAVAAKDETLDQLAAAMAEVATSSTAPAGLLAGLGFGGGGSSAGGGAAAPAAPAPGAPAARPIWLTPEDEIKCANCATCYQELPQLFEAVSVTVDGATRTIAHFKPEALVGLEITPELAATFKRVKDTCDAEIIK
jgi:pyruvate-ferredoxin/flavodoxin oxidoreductase